MSRNPTPTLRDVLARIPHGSAEWPNRLPCAREARNLAWAVSRAASRASAGYEAEARAAIPAALASEGRPHGKLAQALKRLLPLAD